MVIPGETGYLLPHTSLYPDDRIAKATILLIHGAFSSRNEWDLVVPFLETVSNGNYHLLLPDLPGHGEAKLLPSGVTALTTSSQNDNKHQQSRTGFSIRESSALVADLIRRKALGGRAKIVGMSLGAMVAIDLASTVPDVVDEAVFVSGYEIYPSLANSSLAPYGLWMMKRIERAAPRTLVSWLLDGVEINNEKRPTNTDIDDTTRTDESGGEMESCNLALCQDVIAAVSGSGRDKEWPPSTWPARTLIIVAGKKGILPTNDHPEDAKKLRDIGQELNADTIAMTHPLMRHPWNCQDPKLFAETACAWFERRTLPDGFHLL
jgi:pimeloyl-ACP methyl ester carboxylesterase